MVAVAELWWLLPAGVVAGLAGAVAMDVPMNRQPEGWTPAFVAASVVRRRSPEEVPFRDATVVHHTAGVLAGVLYALAVAPLALALGVTRPAVAVAPVAVHAVGVAVVTAFVYVVFAFVVFPRRTPDVPEGRMTAIRGQWLRSTVVFGAALAVVAPAVGVALVA